MNILIIEDRPELATLLVQMLSSLTIHAPVVCGTMEDALTLIRKTDPLDIITVDLGLPDSGSDATILRLREISELKPCAVVLVISGIVTREDEARILKAGAHGFIHKSEIVERNMFFERLMQILRSMLAAPQSYKRNLPVVELLAKTVGAYINENTSRAIHT
jgi:CheY-like chemotaxis protein